MAVAGITHKRRAENGAAVNFVSKGESEREREREREGRGGFYQSLSE